MPATGLRLQITQTLLGDFFVANVRHGVCKWFHCFYASGGRGLTEESQIVNFSLQIT
jgi:hypothetical protein